VLFKPTSTPQAESSWKKGQLLHLTKKNETFKNRKVKQLFSSTLGFILQKNLSMTLQEFFFKKFFFRCN